MPRTKPSAEQVAEVLRRGVQDATTRAIPWREAATAVRVGLRTTKANAEAWLRDAGYEHPTVVAIAYATKTGYLSGVVQPNNGRWPKLGDYVRGAWREAGYNADDYLTLRINSTGQWISEDDRRKALSRLPREDSCFVALPEAARHLLALAERERDAQRAVMAAEQTVEQSVVESEHGHAIRYIRALLAESGIDKRRMERALGASVISVGNSEVALSIQLYDSEIDRLADVIKRLGVTPGA